MRTLIRLGGSQFAVIAGGLVAVLAVWITFMPSLEEFYAREFLVPRLADRYGFRFGILQVTQDGYSHASHGIIAIDPEGAFARMGVRPGDVPFAHHGNGAAAMYHALRAGEQGRVAEFDVVNAADRGGGRGKSGLRTVRVQPPGRAR